MDRIPTWEQVCAHLSARGAKLRALGADRIEATLAPAPGAAPGRMILARSDVGGAAWLELVEVIGSARAVPITNALIDNANAPIGAFCLIDGEFALRQMLPLEGLRAADLDRVIRVMEWRVAETRKLLAVE
jgi:hypothetical protein